MPLNRIEDYALIGDCETAALVSRDGSIDWLCWPRFDSGAVFAALLGGAENGHWSLQSEAPARIARRYREGTLVLETHVSAASGKAIVIDFMPMRTDGSSHVVRIVRGRRGRLRMRTELVLRFGFGTVIPWVTRLGDRCLKAIAGPDMVVLRGDVLPQAVGFLHRGEFTVTCQRRSMPAPC
jgi:GH15 family glucan-1,4-alpha-glucosidase